MGPSGLAENLLQAPWVWALAGGSGLGRIIPHLHPNSLHLEALARCVGAEHASPALASLLCSFSSGLANHGQTRHMVRVGDKRLGTLLCVHLSSGDGEVAQVVPLPTWAGCFTVEPRGPGS